MSLRNIPVLHIGIKILLYERVSKLFLYSFQSHITRDFTLAIAYCSVDRLENYTANASKMYTAFRALN